MCVSCLLSSGTIHLFNIGWEPISRHIGPRQMAPMEQPYRGLRLDLSTQAHLVGSPRLHWGHSNSKKSSLQKGTNLEQGFSFGAFGQLEWVEWDFFPHWSAIHVRTAISSTGVLCGQSVCIPPSTPSWGGLWWATKGALLQQLFGQAHCVTYFSLQWHCHKSSTYTQLIAAQEEAPCLGHQFPWTSSGFNILTQLPI